MNPRTTNILQPQMKADKKTNRECTRMVANKAQKTKQTADGRRFTQIGRIPAVNSGILADLDLRFASTHLDFTTKELTGV
jgi:hypothetical protein